MRFEDWKTRVWRQVTAPAIVPLRCSTGGAPNSYKCFTCELFPGEFVRESLDFSIYPHLLVGDPSLTCSSVVYKLVVRQAIGSLEEQRPISGQSMVRAQPGPPTISDTTNTAI